MDLPSRGKINRGRWAIGGFLVLSIVGSSLFLDWPARLLDLSSPFASVQEEATPESLALPGLAPARELRKSHLSSMGVDRWHQAGHRGRGVKLAILDSSFHGYRDFEANGLPANLATRSFRADRSIEAKESQHGLLCAEVVHAMAPEAELLLVNWEPDQPDSFLDAVRWARSQGARIISCSLIMPSWSDGEGGGPVHAALEKVLGRGDGSDDLLFFASAGNIAQRHWAGSFRPDSTQFHQWVHGKTSNCLRPWGKDRVAVELYGRISSDYELQILDRETGKPVGQATLQRLPAKSKGRCESCCAIVRFMPAPDRSYEVRVRQLNGSPAHRQDKFHMAVLGGYLEHSRAGGSIPFPGDGSSVQAVGAVDGEGRRLFYSSCGPNSRLPKPDFVAAVPFASEFRDRAFAGTSAAAPQAAALAALWWSRNPNWNATQVRKAMQDSTRDLGPIGHDWETGFGLVRLP